MSTVVKIDSFQPSFSLLLQTTTVKVAGIAFLCLWVMRKLYPFPWITVQSFVANKLFSSTPKGDTSLGLQRGPHTVSCSDGIVMGHILRHSGWKEQAMHMCKKTCRIHLLFLSWGHLWGSASLLWDDALCAEGHGAWVGGSFIRFC